MGFASGVASTPAASPVPLRRPGWMVTTCGVLAGTFAAGLLAAPFILLAAWLRVIPIDGGELAGRGWPFPIHSPWSALADLGPLLLLGMLVARCIAFLLDDRAERGVARWPIAVAAVAVGWLPVVDHGLVAVGGFAGFVVMVLATRYAANERAESGSWTRGAVIGARVLAVALAVFTVAYGQLHPFTAEGSDSPVALRDGRGALHFDLHANARTSPRLLGIAPIGVAGLRATAVLTPAHGTTPTSSRYESVLGRRLRSGSHTEVQLRLSGRGACAVTPAELTAVDVRVRTLGAVRTQRVDLGPTPVTCRGR